MNLENPNDVYSLVEYVKCFKKSEIKQLMDFLLKIKSLGVVNMFQSGSFLIMTSQYFSDYMRLKSYENEYDEDLVEEIKNEINEIRDIMIRGGIKMVESKKKEVTPTSVQNAMNGLAKTTVKYYIEGVFKNRN